MLLMTNLTHFEGSELDCLLDEMLNVFEEAMESGEFSEDNLDLQEAISNIYAILDEYEDRNLLLPFRVPTGLLNRTL